MQRIWGYEQVEHEAYEHTELDILYVTDKYHLYFCILYFCIILLTTGSIEPETFSSDG